MLWTAVASLLWTIVLLVAALSLLRLNAIRLSYRRPRHAAVVVLGDIGRSPRMMNHAESLANLGFTVSLVGYASCTRLPHNPGKRPLVDLYLTLPFLLGRSSIYGAPDPPQRCCCACCAESSALTGHPTGTWNRPSPTSLQRNPPSPSTRSPPRGASHAETSCCTS